jgi:hypothetical protein
LYCVQDFFATGLPRETESVYGSITPDDGDGARMTERQIIAALLANPDCTATLQAAQAYLDAPVTPMEGTGDVWLALITWGVHENEPLHAACMARRDLGIARYGHPLRYNTGLDYPREALEELLDAAIYLWAGNRPDDAERALALARRLL